MSDQLRRMFGTMFFMFIFLAAGILLVEKARLFTPNRKVIWVPEAKRVKKQKHIVSFVPNPVCSCPLVEKVEKLPAPKDLEIIPLQMQERH